MGDLKTEDCCENCLCFKEISEKVGGKCRNSPPALHPNGRGGTGIGAWIQPVVDHGDWCAEHINKEMMIDDADFMKTDIPGLGDVDNDSFADDKVVEKEPEADVSEPTAEEKLQQAMGGAPAAKAPPKKKAATKK